MRSTTSTTPVHHAFFDPNDGRVILFEGTYSDFFAAGRTLTPRYNYNQIMYRLSLGDPRLVLPVPVYLVRNAQGSTRYLLREGVGAENAWGSIASVPFFAVPAGTSHRDLTPVFAEKDKQGVVLRSHAVFGVNSHPLFYALPASAKPLELARGASGNWSCTAHFADGSDYTPFLLDLQIDGESVHGTGGGEIGSIQRTFRNGELRLLWKTSEGTYSLRGELKQGKLSGSWQSQGDAAESGTWNCELAPAPHPVESPEIVPLYEYTSVADGSRLYSTDAGLAGEALKRSPDPICRVWRNPTFQLILDRDTKPVPKV